MKSYFSLTELLKTDTCLDNIPRDFDVIENLRELTYVLSMMRLLVGCPIVVTSGYRSTDVNKVVGGVPNSAHLFGRAADIKCSRSTALKSILVEWKKAGILSELLIHDTYFHIAI